MRVGIFPAHCRSLHHRDQPCKSIPISIYTSELSNDKKKTYSDFHSLRSFEQLLINLQNNTLKEKRE
jgi:hypothetical protein